MALVFPEPSAARDGPLGWGEPAVHFYLGSTRPEAVAARAWINAAYERFADPNGKVAGRLRSVDDVQLLSALDELRVHDRLIAHGELVHEEGGVGPDFRIYRDDEYLAAVEVCSLLEHRGREIEQQRHARIADALNETIPLDGWFVHFDVVQLDRQPSLRRLVRWVAAKLAALPDEGAAPSATYELTGVTIHFRFVRRRDESPPAPTDRIVGAGQTLGYVVDSSDRLRSALNKKIQKRYDTRGKPFAIVVGVWDPACTTDQIEDAVLGDLAAGARARLNNGFFGEDRRRPAGRHRDVSAVFALTGWRPWHVGGTTLRFDNPYARVAFPDELLTADYHHRLPWGSATL